eukprot:RCo050731
MSPCPESLIRALVTIACLVWTVSSIDEVTVLNQDTFNPILMSTPQFTWIVEFHSGGQDRLLRQAVLLSEHMSGVARVGTLLCESDAALQLAARFRVTSFPSLRAFVPNIQGVMSSRVPLHKKAVIDFFSKSMPNLLTNVTNSSTLASFLKLTYANIGKPPSGGGQGSSSQVLMDPKAVPPDAVSIIRPPRVLIFSEKSKPILLTRALAALFMGRLLMCVVSKNADLAGRYQVERLPALVVLPTDGPPVHYRGELRYGPIAAFLQDYALPADSVTAPNCPPLVQAELEKWSTSFQSPIAEGVPHDPTSSEDELASKSAPSGRRCGIPILYDEDEGNPYREFQGLRFDRRALTAEELRQRKW